MHPEFPLPAGASPREFEGDDSLALARAADLVVANTAAAVRWVERLDRDLFARVLWWIHEVDVVAYPGVEHVLPAVGAAVFDSRASLDAWRAVSGLPPAASVIHPALPPPYRVPSRWMPAAVRERRQRPRRERARRALGVGPGDFLVGCFASYHAQKGQDLLATTLGELALRRTDIGWKALFVGFTSSDDLDVFSDGLSEAARAVIGERVRPQLPSLADLYPALDVLVVNTQEPGETFGRVALEAMAHGLPVLATAGGGVSEVVVDGITGLLHPMGVAGQQVLAANLVTLADDRALARRLGRAGAARLRAHFAPYRFERELLAVIRRLLAGPRGV